MSDRRDAGGPPEAASAQAAPGPAGSPGAGGPLHGQVIGLTRDRADDLALFEPLVELGARLAWIPLTRKVATDDAPLIAARVRAGGFTDLVFTSANGVRVVKGVLDDAGLDAGALGGVATWAVGAQTAAAMRAALGVGADHVPAEASADGLVALAASVGVSGRRFLFPAARGARRVLPDGLTALGATVDQVAIYETLPAAGAEALLIAAVEAGLSLITVASPSAVYALAAACDGARLDRASIPLAAIGPTTAAAATEEGFRVPIVSGTYSLGDLALAVVEAARAGALTVRRDV